MLLRSRRSFQMKTAALFLILFVNCSYAFGQNLIGYNDAEIRKFMKQNRKDMNFNNVKNSMFRYLKYSDSSDSQTILFFLTADSVCKGVRVICDNSMKPERLKSWMQLIKRSVKTSGLTIMTGKITLLKLKMRNGHVQLQLNLIIRLFKQVEATELLKKSRRIEIKTRGLSRHIFAGEYHSAFKGQWNCLQ